MIPTPRRSSPQVGQSFYYQVSGSGVSRAPGTIVIKRGRDEKTLFLSAGIPGLFPAVKHVKKRKHRMSVCHAGTREFHNTPYFFLFGRRIAVDLAVGARRFVLLKRARRKACFRIIL